MPVWPIAVGTLTALAGFALWMVVGRRRPMVEPPTHAEHSVTPVVIRAFSDESADEREERVFAASALLGTEEEWELAEALWRTATRDEDFHATDWERSGRHQEYDALVQVLSSGPVSGVAYAVDLPAFRAVYSGTLREAAYMRCFGYVVAEIAGNAISFNDAQTEIQISRIECTFDRRKKTEFSAKRAYSAYFNEPNWKPASLLAPELRFADRSHPRIQMADLVARECMKDLDRLVSGSGRPERASKAALAASERFKFFQMRQADFERMKERHASVSFEGFSEAACHAWLRRTGAQDTWDNRVRFLEYLDRKR